MQRRLYILLAIVAAAVSCQTGEDHIVSPLPEGEIMRFTTAVVESRAEVTDDNLTEFGITVENSSDDDYSYKNVYASKSGDEWMTKESILWQNENQEVKITAHTPYDSDFNNALYPLRDQRSEEAFINSDHLFACSVVSPSVTDTTKDIFCDANGVVNVGLKHVLAKLTINLKFSGTFYGITENPITSVSIGGIAESGVIDEDSYEVTPNSGSDATFYSFCNDDFSAKDRTVSYEVILVPQTISQSKSSVLFTIDVDGKLYKWRPESDITLMSGRNHTLSLKVGKDEDMIFMEDEITVKDWSSSKIEIDNGDGTIGAIKVGDLYPNDVNPIGVVYAVNPDGLSGKIVSLNQTQGAWSKTTTPTYANDESNGLANMRTIKSMDIDYTNHPACAWVNSENDVTNDYADNSKGVWYLPSKDELKELHTAFIASDVVAAAIEKAEGTSFTPGYYWSSTETVTYNTSIWVEIFLGTMEFESADKSDDVNFTRAILAF